MNNVFFYQPDQSKLASYEHVAITYSYSDGNILPQKKTTCVKGFLLLWYVALGPPHASQ